MRERFYIAVKPSLAPGFAVAQAIHAALAWREEHGVPPETVVVLRADPTETQALVPRARTSLFREPDLNDEPTALAIGPEGAKALRRLPLF